MYKIKYTSKRLTFYGYFVEYIISFLLSLFILWFCINIYNTILCVFIVIILLIISYLYCNTLNLLIGASIYINGHIHKDDYILYIFAEIIGILTCVLFWHLLYPV